MLHALHFTDHFQIHTFRVPTYNVGESESPVGASLEKWALLFQRAEDLDAEELRSMLPKVPI